MYAVNAEVEPERVLVTHVWAYVCITWCHSLLK